MRASGISAGHSSASSFPRRLLFMGGAMAMADLPRQPPALSTASFLPSFLKATAWKRLVRPSHTCSLAALNVLLCDRKQGRTAIQGCISRMHMATSTAPARRKGAPTSYQHLYGDIQMMSSLWRACMHPSTNDLNNG